jgi:hypothetical protein
MRMPRFRFTVRRMMAAVALVALILAVVVLAPRWWRHYEYHRSYAQAMGGLEANLARAARCVEGGGAVYLDFHGFLRPMERAPSRDDFPPRLGMDSGFYRARGEYFANRRREHERASWRPWATFQPSGPPPRTKWTFDKRFTSNPDALALP